MTGYHRNGQSPGSLVDFDDNGELFSFGEEQFEQLGAELRESAAERSDTQFIEDPEWLNEVIPQNQTGDVWAYQLDDVILQGTEMDQIGYANDYFQTEVQQNTLQAPLAFPSGPDEQQGVIANSSQVLLPAQSSYPPPDARQYDYPTTTFQDPTLLGIEPPFQEGSEMLTSSDFNQISAQLAIGHKPPSAVRSPATHSGERKNGRSTSNSMSWNSSLESIRKQSVDATQLKYPLQKPRRSSSHWWVRINNTTEGKTIRSGKINQYDPKRYYKECPQPHGNWHSKYYAFRYNKFGELDKPMYSARQIHEFLFEHPRTEKFRLRLWIQRAPADSARRYHTPQSSRCRFKCCPAHKYTKGTILHGHLRVAFDERWHTYQKNADPFHCAGYVHLYCLERFLDFPAVCRHVDIKVDTRSFNTEPNHRFAAAFDNGPDLYLAETFLRTASRDLDAFKAKYPKYPDHADFERGAEKPYKETLCYLITKARHDARGAGTRKQLERVGGNKASTMAVHLGDLEVYCQARMEARKSKREAKRKRQDGGEDDSDSERHQKRSRSRPIERDETISSPASIPSSPRRSSRLHRSPPIDYNEEALARRASSMPSGPEVTRTQQSWNSGQLILPGYQPLPPLEPSQNKFSRNLPEAKKRARSGSVETRPETPKRVRFSEDVGRTLGSTKSSSPASATALEEMMATMEGGTTPRPELRRSPRLSRGSSHSGSLGSLFSDF